MPDRRGVVLGAPSSIAQDRRRRLTRRTSGITTWSLGSPAAAHRQSGDKLKRTGVTTSSSTTIVVAMNS
jgi:hypothetical protein